MKIKCIMLLAFSYLLAANTSISAEPGRLFSTPAERAKLDYLRQTSKQSGPEQAQEMESDLDWAAPPAMPGSVSVQGYVKRSDGKKGTVWVNNMPVQESSDLGEVRVGKLPRDGGQVQINIPASGRNVNLKAGQIYMPETDSISEDKARATDMSRPDVQDAGTIGADPSNEP